MPINQTRNSVQGQNFSRNFVFDFSLGGLIKYHLSLVYQAYLLQESILVASQDFTEPLQLFGGGLLEGNLLLEGYLPQELTGGKCLNYDHVLESFLGEMAEGSGPGGGIPLHEFRREVPPGWAPGLPDYPLRLFFERLKLWYRIYEGDDTMVGPDVSKERRNVWACSSDCGVQMEARTWGMHLFVFQLRR